MTPAEYAKHHADMEGTHVSDAIYMARNGHYFAAIENLVKANARRELAAYARQAAENGGEGR